MRPIMISLFLLTTLAVKALGQTPSATFDAVVRGMSCKQSSVASNPGQLDCEYKVGRDLEFVIAGVGEPDVAITVVRASGYDSDFYASVGLLHGCVIVKPGSKTNAATLRSGTLPGMAFVSPKTGKVYRTWQQCGEAR